VLLAAQRARASDPLPLVIAMVLFTVEGSASSSGSDQQRLDLRESFTRRVRRSTFDFSRRPIEPMGREP
jgi:hypothetical protein